MSYPYYFRLFCGNWFKDPVPESIMTLEYVGISRVSPPRQYTQTDSYRSTGYYTSPPCQYSDWFRSSSPKTVIGCFEVSPRSQAGDRQIFMGAPADTTEFTAGTLKQDMGVISAPECRMILMMNFDTPGVVHHQHLNNGVLQEMR